MSKLPSPAGSPQWVDLIAFVSVLVTGILLTSVGHLTAVGVASVCTAIAGLYGAWRGLPTLPGRREPGRTFPAASDRCRGLVGPGSVKRRRSRSEGRRRRS